MLSFMLFFLLSGLYDVIVSLIWSSQAQKLHLLLTHSAKKVGLKGEELKQLVSDRGWPEELNQGPV